MLEVLQTIGICVSATALTAIAIMLFLLVSYAVPPPSYDLTEFDEEDEDAEAAGLKIIRGMSPEQIETFLKTPVPPTEPRRKRKK